MPLNLVLSYVSILTLMLYSLCGHASIEHRVLHKQRFFILADVLVCFVHLAFSSLLQATVNPWHRHEFFRGNSVFWEKQGSHVPLAHGNAAPHHVPDDILCFKSEQPHHLPLGSKMICCMGDTNCEKWMTIHIEDSKSPCWTPLLLILFYTLRRNVLQNISVSFYSQSTLRTSSYVDV